MGPLEKKFDYSKQKRLWLKNKSGSKIKLRKFISDVAENLVKINGQTLEINREHLIKAYNEGGLELTKKWVDLQFEENNKKD